jgi:NitT/TauT family transport system substrate-binding protein
LRTAIRILSTLVFAAGLVLFGCGEQPPEPAAGTPELDIYAEAPLIRVGYVKQDHHSAMFVSALRGQEMSEVYPVYLVHLGEDFYALIKDGEKVAEVQAIQSQGAMEVPNNMNAGVFDIGFGGVAAFASSNDKETGVTIVSPLHFDGDMLVVSIENDQVEDWQSFVEWAMNSPEPVTIAFKSPTAVAVVILEAGLTAAGVPYSYSANPQPGSQVLLFNAQGEANLNPMLQEGTIDGYVSNNPHPFLSAHNGIGKVVAALHELPPGIFGDHPCCALAATASIIDSNPAEVAAVLELFMYATDYINTNPEDAAAAVSDWCGVPYDVSLASMATSIYDMRVSPEFMSNMHLILENMRSFGIFTGPLLEDDGQAVEEHLYDFSLLPEELIQI